MYYFFVKKTRKGLTAIGPGPGPGPGPIPDWAAPGPGSGARALRKSSASTTKQHNSENYMIIHGTDFKQIKTQQIIIIQNNSNNTTTLTM